MHYWKGASGTWYLDAKPCDDAEEDNIPAWSLHRLIVLNLDTDLPSAYEGIEGQKNIYDEVIDYLEWLIKEGYFPKEYLQEQAGSSREG